MGVKLFKLKTGIRFLEYTLGGLLLALYLIDVFVYTTVMIQANTFFYSLNVGLTKAFGDLSLVKYPILIYIVLVILVETMFYMGAKER